MNFKLLRKKYTVDSCLGELIGESGIIFESLERLFDGKCKIPPGSYLCTVYDSPHFGYKVFMLNDVPGHDHILIHIANTFHDLDGCIGIGTTQGEDSIGESRKAFEKFMAIQEYKPFTLAVED